MIAPTFASMGIFLRRLEEAPALVVGGLVLVGGVADCEDSEVGTVAERVDDGVVDIEEFCDDSAIIEEVCNVDGPGIVALNAVI